MKKVKWVFLATLLLSKTSLALPSTLGLGFVAPQINGRVHVSNPVPGEIVLDVNGMSPAFWGFNGIGWLQLGGGTGTGAKNISKISANYSTTASDDVILVDASAGSVEVTLDSAATLSGKMLTIKKTDASWQKIVTIVAIGGEMVDSATTTSLNTQNEVVSIVSDGTNWKVASRTIPGKAISTGITTNIIGGNEKLFWKRDGGDLVIWGKIIFLSSTSLSGQFSFFLPPGLEADVNQIAGTNHRVGVATASDYPGTGDRETYGVFLAGSSKTSLSVAGRTDAGAYGVWTNTFPFPWATDDTMIIHPLRIPIEGWNGN